MARIVNATGVEIIQNDLASIRYSVYLLNDQDPDQRTTITGHDNVSLTIADVISNVLQVNSIWTIDTIGYNFCHVLNVSTSPAFSIAGRRYLIEYRLTPTLGQIILVRFRLNVI